VQLNAVPLPVTTWPALQVGMVTGVTQLKAVPLPVATCPAVQVGTEGPEAGFTHESAPPLAVRI
jgi:hypothetical protein